MGIAACLDATETLMPWQQWPGDGGVGMGYLNAAGGFEVCVFFHATPLSYSHTSF